MATHDATWPVILGVYQNVFKQMLSFSGMRPCELFDMHNCTNAAIFTYEGMSLQERAASCGKPVCIDPCTFLEYLTTVSSAAYPSPLFKEIYLKQTGSTRYGIINLNFVNLEEILDVLL
jgi:hypothetical protein